MKKEMDLLRSYLYKNPILLGDMFYILGNKERLLPEFLDNGNVIEFLDNWSFYLRVESAVLLLEDELNLVNNEELNKCFNDYKRTYIIIYPLTCDILEHNITIDEGIKTAKKIPRIFSNRLEKSIIWKIVKKMNLSGYNPMANIDEDLIKMVPIYEENPIILTSALIEKQKLRELLEAEEKYNEIKPRRLTEIFLNQLNLILARLYYYKSIIRTNDLLTCFPIDSMMPYREFNINYYLKYREEYLKKTRDRVTIPINLEKIDYDILDFKVLFSLFKRSNSIIVPSIENEKQRTGYIKEMRQIIDIFLNDNQKKL